MHILGAVASEPQHGGTGRMPALEYAEVERVRMALKVYVRDSDPEARHEWDTADANVEWLRHNALAATAPTRYSARRVGRRE